jgi:hypothetical protein
MKTRYYQYAVIAIAATLLMACNGIETVGLDADSVISKHKTSLIRDVNVTQNEAIGIANMFARSNGGDIPQTKGAFSSTKMISSSETIREDGQNLMYVFNYQGGGFVIVGSTRNYYPILAYSDEGSFILQDDMGPVDVWLDETKVSIKNSGSLDNDTKAQMQNLWARYDGTFVDPAQALLAARRPQTRSTGEDYCGDEIEDLQTLYGDEGWTFLPLSFVEDLFTDLGLSSVYADLCYCASQNNSALNETVIGYRYPAINQVGPLLQTEWHQDAPYNDSCPNHYPAGSGVIAAAQVMKYYEEPPTINMLDGTTITWADIPISPNTTPNKIPQLIKRLGQLCDASYGSSVTIVHHYDVMIGADSLGYSVDYVSGNNESYYHNQVLYYHRPVIMFGAKNTDPLIDYAWVCDGVRQTVYNEIQFFTENQPNGGGNFYQGMYTYNNPGLAGQPVGSPTYTYHMNWGQTNGAYNGWFTANYVFSAPINYNENRKNLLIYY